MQSNRVRIVGALLLGHLVATASSLALAQNSASPNDTGTTANHLYQDAKSFQEAFQNSVKKAAISNTSRGKEATDMVAHFVRQAEMLRDDDPRQNKAEADAKAVISSGEQIDHLVTTVQLDASAVSAWAAVQKDLGELGKAYEVPISKATAGEEPGSCEKEIGLANAKLLVEQCLQVSPATHPPCNVQNPCALIKDEIRRGCGMLTGNAPKFCGEYR